MVIWTARARTDLKAIHDCIADETLEQQLASPDVHRRSFEDRFALMLEQELLERGNARLAQPLRWAKLPVQACVEDLDTRTARGIDSG